MNILRSSIAGSSRPISRFFKDHLHRFPHGVSSLHSYQQWISIFLLLFLILSVLNWVSWNPKEVLICTFWIAKNVELLKVFLSHLDVLFWELPGSMSPFLIGMFVLLVFSCLSSSYSLDANPLSVAQLVKISSHYVVCLFAWTMCPLLYTTF